jgi:hypothetical protein
LAGISPVFGPFSVIFCKRFQKAKRLPQTGQVNQATLTALEPHFDALARSWYAKFPVGYVNPMRYVAGLVPERTDDGVDYGGDKGSPIGAIGRSRIIEATTHSGWPGPYGSSSGFGGTGGLIHGVFLDGPNAGETWYLAEYIYVDVRVGDIVEAGQTIARFYHDASSGVGIEYGFGDGGNNQHATEAGKCFARLLKSTGCPVRDNPGPGSTHSPYGRV